MFFLLSEEVEQVFGVKGGTDAGAEFGGIEGLDDVIGGAHFQAAEFFLGGGRAGEEDDGDFRGGGIGLEAAADFEAVDAGKIDIEENEVGPQPRRWPGPGDRRRRRRIPGLPGSTRPGPAPGCPRSRQ